MRSKNVLARSFLKPGIRQHHSHMKSWMCDSIELIANFKWEFKQVLVSPSKNHVFGSESSILYHFIEHYAASKLDLRILENVKIQSV